MGNAINTEKMFINGKDIEDFGAKALREYKVGGTAITNDYFQGRNRTNYTLMDTTFGLKSLTFTLVFHGKYQRDAALYKSECEAEMIEGCEIFMPDGFYYRCMLDSIGDSEIKGVDGEQVIISAAYKLSGIQHDELVVVDNGSSFHASGTMPKMDCRLSVVVGANASSYTLAGAVFSNVVAGDVLVFDGINKRFLKNGAPTTASEWIKFPSVVPGYNSIVATDPVKVEYYPCYV